MPNVMILTESAIWLNSAEMAQLGSRWGQLGSRVLLQLWPPHSQGHRIWAGGETKPGRAAWNHPWGVWEGQDTGKGERLVLSQGERAPDF